MIQRLFPRTRRGALLLSACAGFSLLGGAVHAGTMPHNLGSGLDALVESNLKLQAARKDGTADKLPMYDGFATAKAANVAGNIIRDSSGRVMVRVMPNGLKPLADVRKAAEAAAPSLKVSAVDQKYHGAGTFEGFVSLDDVPALARLEGVSSVRLTPKPIHARLRGQPTTPGMPNAVFGEQLNKVGTVFDFGVTQHRVDQISKIYNPAAAFDYEGRGVSVGVMSDSFDTSGGSITAADDEASGDLPGVGGKVNGTPVTVLQDFPNATDEGRGMCQTVFKMAPKARLAFATADEGEIGFANNIRALAALPGFAYPTATQKNFKADVIVDDVSYYDEPFFQDGIVAQGVNDVVNAGVSYFSSAANNYGTNGYDAPFRFVANGTGLTAASNKALAGTNINLANVPTALYAGGFQNFNANGLDVAQTVNYPNAATLANYGLATIPTILQWSDPDDTTTPNLTGQIFAGSGTITYNPTTMAGNVVSFKIPLVKGQEYYFVCTPASTPTTPGDNPLDPQIIVLDPSGNQVSFTDNGGSGAAEYALDFAPVSGTYTIEIAAFEIPQNDVDITDGSFTLDIFTASGKERITQDLNLLVFDLAGNFLPDVSAASNNLANNSPIEFAPIVAPNSDTQVQFVIARSNQQPTSGRAANRMRYLCFGDGITSLGPAEYFTYLTPVTFGHSCAAGANGVAAYAYYKPNLPEYYTSPGPSTIYFDANNNSLGAPDVRQKPDVAAMDGANTTFFGFEDLNDVDSFPNFFGTSDAAPHAAAIAALVLEAHGGKGSVTPAQMKNVLQRSAFQHDLDPFFSTGSAFTRENGKVTITVRSDDESGRPGTTGAQDPNSILVTYNGPGSLKTLVFNPSGSPSTSGNVTGGTNGLTPNGAYFVTSTPGFLFGPAIPFTLGTSSAGLTAASVTATPSNLATFPPNAVAAGRFFTESLAFTPGAFTDGKFIHFTTARYEFRSADVTTSGGTSVSDRSADLFGGGVSIPDGKVTYGGMTFSGTTTSGAPFSGVIMNNIGSGYSPQDGYGFINAQNAVLEKLQ